MQSIIPSRCCRACRAHDECWQAGWCGGWALSRTGWVHPLQASCSATPVASMSRGTAHMSLLKDVTSVAEQEAGKGGSAAPPPGDRPCSQPCVTSLRPVTESQLRATFTSHWSKAVLQTQFHEYCT